MPLTLPDRNSIVEMPVAVPTGEAAADQPPLAIKAPKAKPSRKRVTSKPKFLAITEGSGSGGEEKRPSMADHPVRPFHLLGFPLRHLTSVHRNGLNTSDFLRAPCL